MKWKPNKISGVVFNIITSTNEDLGNFEFPPNTYLSKGDEINVPNHSGARVIEVRCSGALRTVIIGYVAPTEISE